MLPLRLACQAVRVPLQADHPVTRHPSWRRRGHVRVALWAAAALVLMVVLAQLVLPPLAADRVRSRVAKYGHVDTTSVTAWPALELLWGKADSATVHASTLTLTPAQVSSLLWEARNVTSMTVIARHVTLEVAGLPDGLTVEHVAMHKQGSHVDAQATLTQAQLDAALPNGFHVRPIATGPEGVRVQASGGLFGATASLRALLSVVHGRLVASPQGLPFGGLAMVTLFADPHLYIRSIGVTVRGGHSPVYGLSLVASLR
jgi:hypothetical protein